jgi:hypothetical protein
VPHQHLVTWGNNATSANGNVLSWHVTPPPPFFPVASPSFLSLPPRFSLSSRADPLPLPSSLFFFFFSSPLPLHRFLSHSLSPPSPGQSISRSLSAKIISGRHSPSSSTPAGISSASPSISSPQECDLLSCYHALIPLLSLETLTNSRRVRVLFL